MTDKREVTEEWISKKVEEIINGKNLHAICGANGMCECGLDRICGEALKERISNALAEAVTQGKIEELEYIQNLILIIYSQATDFPQALRNADMLIDYRSPLTTKADDK